MCYLSQLRGFLVNSYYNNNNNIIIIILISEKKRPESDLAVVLLHPYFFPFPPDNDKI